VYNNNNNNSNPICKAPECQKTSECHGTTVIIEIVLFDYCTISAAKRTIVIIFIFIAGIKLQVSQGYQQK